MGKKSLKNYKKNKKEEAREKNIFKQDIIYNGNDIINNFKGDFDSALLHCLDRKLSNDMFDYIYNCQIEHEKKVEEILEKIKRRIDDCASDVAFDFQMYSEKRDLDLASYVTGSDISDFVMYISRKKLYTPSVFDNEIIIRKKKKIKIRKKNKWTVLATNPHFYREKASICIQKWWKKIKNPI